MSFRLLECKKKRRSSAKKKLMSFKSYLKVVDDFNAPFIIITNFNMYLFILVLLINKINFLSLKMYVLDSEYLSFYVLFKVLQQKY